MAGAGTLSRSLRSRRAWLGSVGCAVVTLAGAPWPALAGDAVPRDDRDRTLRTIAWWERYGLARDAGRLLVLLRDPDPMIRREAEVAIWAMWARSGDAAVDRRIAQGIAQMRGGQRQRAIATFTAVIGQKPAFADAWNRRASARFVEKDPTSALDDCRRAVALDAGHFGAWAGQGYCHAALNDPAAAALAWSRALDLNPNLDGVQRSLREALAHRPGRRAVVI